MIIRPSRPTDAESVMAIWRSAVDATHDFLHPLHRQEIEIELRAFLPNAPLLLAVDDHDKPLGYMLLEGAKLEALFIDASAHGQGIGRALVMHALSLCSPLTTDVNEQNPQALGFYQHLGFRVTGRSARDGQNRPYPLLHLQRD